MPDRPLKPQGFQILLALAGGDLHGYAIQRAVLEQTRGQMHLWPATLYRTLAALEADGLIEQVSAPADEPQDERRQYYRLTRPGRARLREQAALLRAWADAAGRAEPT